MRCIQLVFEVSARSQNNPPFIMYPKDADSDPQALGPTENSDDVDFKLMRVEEMTVESVCNDENDREMPLMGDVAMVTTSDSACGKSAGSNSSIGKTTQGSPPMMGSRRILKNVFVLSLGFAFMFTAYCGIASLQTSLNKEEGIGAWGLSATYMSMILPGIHLPPFVIARFGCKWTMTVSTVFYALFIAANFYAVQGTIIPASVLLGVAGALLWTAKCTYMTQIGTWYAKLTNQRQHDVINLFFGMFFLFFQSSKIWGSLISSLVFSKNEAKDKNHTAGEQVCGAHFCPWDASAGSQAGNFEQSLDKVHTLCGIYLGSSIMATVLMTTFLDRIVLDKEMSEEDRRLSPRLLVATFKHLISSPCQIMLVPVSVYNGVQKGFLEGDYTKSFISCSLGIWNLGYVVMCYGLVCAGCCILFGRLARFVGHVAFFVLAFLTHGALLVALLLWTPQSDEEQVFYVIAGLWGAADAAMSTQLNALYGHVFIEATEAAFSNYRLWEAVGYATTFALNEYLCTRIKIFLCLATLSLAMVGYALAENRIRRHGGVQSLERVLQQTENSAAS